MEISHDDPMRSRVKRIVRHNPITAVYATVVAMIVLTLFVVQQAGWL